MKPTAALSLAPALFALLAVLFAACSSPVQLSGPAPLVEIDRSSLPSAQALSLDVVLRGSAKGGDVSRVTASVNGGVEQTVQTAAKLPAASTTFSYTLSGVQAGAKYDVTIRAYSSSGQIGKDQVTFSLSTPTPTPTTGRMIWYNSWPADGMNTDQLTPTMCAKVNAMPFDGITLLVRGVSWESMRSGYTLDTNNLLTQLRKADCITKKKALLLLTSWPGSPANTAAWNAMIRVQGQIAAALKQVPGWTTIFHDNEPYQDSTGGQLPGPNYYDYGWWMIYAKDERIRTYHRQLANTLSANYPGLHYVWYHGPYAGDYTAPGWVAADQIGHDFGGARLAFFGMLEAIVQDGAKIVLHDGGESYEGQGRSFYQNSAAYRTRGILDNVSDLSPAARAAYAKTVQVDFGRMRGHGSTTSAAGVKTELGEMWASLGGQGYVWYYVEDNFGSVGPEILDGVKAFQAGPKPQGLEQAPLAGPSAQSTGASPSFVAPNHQIPTPPAQ